MAGYLMEQWKHWQLQTSNRSLRKIILHVSLMYLFFARSDPNITHDIKMVLISISITGHFWDPRSPIFFSKDDMKKPDFRISIIADISCDVNGPIPSTTRATTISDPFYSFNPY